MASPGAFPRFPAPAGLTAMPRRGRGDPFQAALQAGSEKNGGGLAGDAREDYPDKQYR